MAFIGRASADPRLAVRRFLILSLPMTVVIRDKRGPEELLRPGIGTRMTRGMHRALTEVCFRGKGLVDQDVELICQL